MPRAKKTAPVAAPAPTPATGSSSTRHLFQSRKAPERGGALTRERLAEHMDAFRQSGGTIEVLGTTRALQRIGQPDDAAPAPQPASPTPRKRAR